MFALVLALTFHAAPSQAAALEAIEKQETLNAELEASFDKVCGALKGGRRVLAPAVVAEGVSFPVAELLQLTGCSMRALDIGALADGALPIRLLWDLDGRGAAGERISVRSISTAAMAKDPKAGWKLTRVDTTGFERVVREGRRFVERAAAAGLTLPPRSAATRPAEFLSAGLTVRDFDADGLPDVIAIDGPTAWLFRGRPGVTFAKPEKLASAPADTVFTDVGAGDFDGDGDADLALTTFRDAPVRLFRNDKGAFVEAGRFGAGGKHQAVIPSDLDGDGKLDLAVLTYPLEGSMPSTFLLAENGDPPEFWMGKGDLSFKRYSPPKGVLQRHWSFAGVAFDLLGEGRKQVYIVNDFGVKDLYRFLPDGGMDEHAEASGLRDPGPGMSLDLGDLNGDGLVDLYVSNMFSKAGTRIMAHAAVDAKTKALVGKHVSGNSLFLAQPDGGFLEQAKALGVDNGLWSFGSLMSDTDDDGRLEVLVANGYISATNRKDY